MKPSTAFGLPLMKRATDSRGSGKDEALPASELRYRRLFESAKDGILILDAETGMVVDVNPFLIELLGFSHETFVGKKIWELGFFKDVFANQASFTELRQQGYVRYEDKPLEAADGRRIEVEFVSNVYLVNHHNVIQCNIRDITARKRFEAKHAHLAAIVDSCDDAIISKTLDGVITSCNRAAERLYGYSAPEVLGRSVSVLVPPDQPDEVPQILEQLRRGERIDHYETVRMRKDGTRIPICVTISPVRGPSGTVVGASVVAHDPSERKQAEEALRTNEERLKVGLRLANIAVFNQDRELRYTWMHNPQLGYTTDQVLGKTDAELLLAADAERITALKRHVLEANEGAREEVHITKDGRVLVYDVALEPLRDATGAVIGLTGASFDITERTRAEEALRQSEQHFRSLIEGALDLVAILDADGTYGYVSPSHEQASGFRPEELVGENGLDFLHPDDVPHMRQLLAEVIRSHQLSASGEFRFRHKDGSWHVVEGVFRDLLDDPVVGGILVNARDVTDRKRAEEAAQRRERRFRALIEQSQDLVSINDRDGTYLYVNPAHVAVCGFKPDERVGRNAFDLLHPDDVQKLVPVLAEAIRTGVREATVEYRLRHKDGSWHAFEGLALNLLDDPDVAGILITGRDITERKRAEAEQAALF